ncbi:MAG: PAC2 family protein, partial [Ilumatobacteraceae bacterium]
ASAAAAAAMTTLQEESGARPLATFDGDSFIDYRARRPTMELRDGVNVRLVWADIELSVGADADGHDVLTLSGPEPDSQWRRFADVVSTLSVQLGVTKMVALGAYPFATPHTRDPRLSSSSPSPDVVASIAYLKNSIDVPAGMGAVLEHAFVDKGVPALGLWAQVPHYVSAMSYPAATLALLNGLHEVAGIRVDVAAIRQETIIQRQRLDQLVAGNDEHRAMVNQLEELYDSQQQTGMLGAAGIPTGDELAAEFEQFLRDQDS